MTLAPSLRLCRARCSRIESARIVQLPTSALRGITCRACAHQPRIHPANHAPLPMPAFLVSSIWQVFAQVQAIQRAPPAPHAHQINTRLPLARLHRIAFVNPAHRHARQIRSLPDHALVLLPRHLLVRLLSCIEMVDFSRP